MTSAVEINTFPIEETQSWENLQVLCSLESVVIIVNETRAKILQIRVGNIEGNLKEVHNFEDHVICSQINGHFLIVYLASKILHIFNLKNDRHIFSEINSNSSKIKEIFDHNLHVMLVNERNEFFKLTSDLDAFFEVRNNGSEMPNITLEKVEIGQMFFRNFFFLPNSSLYVKHTGNMHVEVSCSITDMDCSIDTDSEIEAIVPYKDSSDILVTTSYNNRKIFNIIHTNFYNALEKNKIENNDLKKVIGGIGNMFYYISSDGNAVFLNHVEEKECNRNDISLNNYLSNSGTLSGSDLENYYKNKINHLKSLIFYENGVEDIEMIKDYLEKVNDIDFVISVCQELVQHDLSLSKIAYKVRNAISNDLSKYKVSEFFVKIEIIDLIFLKQLDMSITPKNIFESNFINICQKLLSQGELEAASICWLKYICIRSEILAGDDLLVLLNEIPKTVKLYKFMMWLNIFLPSVLRNHPFLLDSIIFWSIDQVYFLEKSKYWPDIAIKFTADLQDILTKSCKPIAISCPLIEKFTSIVSLIGITKDLKEKYQINIRMSELTRLSPSEIVKIILQRAFTEDLKLLLVDFIPRYMLFNSLEHDNLLIDYIKELIECSVIDEIRLQILIDSFYNSEKKLECLLCILRNLDVPWSDTTKKMAYESLKIDSKYKDKILDQIKLSNSHTVLKKYNYPLDYHDYHNIIRKILKAESTSSEDVKSILLVSERVSTFTYAFYIKKCIKQGNICDAIKYFNFHDENKKKHLTKIIEKEIECMLNSTRKNLLQEKHYLDFIVTANVSIISQWNKFKNIYMLKNFYNLYMTLNEYCKEHERYTHFETWISEAIGKYSLSLFYQKSLQVLSLLELDIKKANILIFKAISTDLYTQIFLTFFKSGKHFPFEIILSNINWICQFESTENKKDLDFILNIFTAQLKDCDVRNINILLNVVNILDSLSMAVLYGKHSMISWKFYKMYVPISCYTMINDLLKVYTSDMVTEYTKVTSNEGSEIYKLVCDKELVSCKFFASMLKSIKISENLPRQIYNIRDTISKKMALKVLATRQVDELLLINITVLMQQPIPWFLEIIDNSEDSHKCCNVAEILIKMDKNISILELGSKRLANLNNIVNARGVKDTDVDLVFSNTSNFKISEHKKYVTCLESFNDVNKTLITTTSTKFNISLDDGYTLAIVISIQNWKLDYSQLVDSFGFDVFLANTNESVLYKKCFYWATFIKDKSILLNCLKELWNSGEVTIFGLEIKLNPYFYEQYLCVIQLLKTFKIETKLNKNFLLLHFLKYYKRTTQPTDNEMKMYLNNGFFPEIGKYRMPFQIFLSDAMWSQLKLEITLNTYKIWLKVIELISLHDDFQTNKDMLCGTAVKQTMLRENKTIVNRDNWSLFVTNDDLLKRAHECVQFISNPEWAMACLFHVQQGCRKGADQVAAAKICYQYANHLLKVQPNNQAVKQMQLNYSALSTMHALHKLGFQKVNSIKQCRDSQQLIKLLYIDDSIPRNIDNKYFNRVIDEIAENNGINISALRMQILESLIFSHNTNMNESYGIDKQTLLKVCRILVASPTSVAALYLARIGLDGELECSKHKRLTTLQCLISLADDNTLQKLFNLTPNILWLHIMDLYFSLKLEKLDLSHLVSLFLEDKAKAILQIWQSGELTKEITSTVVEICISYNIRSCDVTINIIKYLIQFDMYEKLFEYLPFIGFIKCDLLLTAWSMLLVSPFERSDFPMTPKQKKLCLDVLTILPQCPVLAELPVLNKVWHHCIRCKCPEIGCLLLPFIEIPERQEWLKQLDISKKLISTIKNLSHETCLADTACYILENSDQFIS